MTLDLLTQRKCDYYEPTQNQMGYMTTHIDHIGHAFLNFAQHVRSPVIDIGAAYGHVALEAASRKIDIIANDLDPRHLDIILQRANEQQASYICLLYTSRCV